MVNTEANGGKRQAAMVFILITLFIDILGIGIVIPVLPELVKDFIETSERREFASDEDLPSHAAEALPPELAGSPTSSNYRDQNLTTRASWYVGVIGTSYSLMQFLFAPIMGALSDRFGRRPIILASLFGLGVDFLIQGFAPSIGWLFVGRLLAGVMGASFTTANAYIADISTPENRARNFGLTGVMFGLGFIFGPAFGGILGSYDLRLPFFVSAALALVNWLYGYFILPESLPVEQRSPFRLAKANPFGSIVYLKKYPVVAGLALSLVFMSLAQRGLENVWVLYTSHRFDWDVQANGRALGLVGVMAMIVQGGLVRPIVARLGERRTVLLGIAVSAMAFLGYAFASQGWMLLAIIVFGAFGGIAGPALQSIVAGNVSASEQGQVQGALTSLVSLTSIFAPVLFTTCLFGYFTSDRAVFSFPGISFFVGSILWCFAMVAARRVFARWPADQSVE